MRKSFFHYIKAISDLWTYHWSKSTKAFFTIPYINSRISKFYKYYLDDQSIEIAELRKKFNLTKIIPSKYDGCLFLDWIETNEISVRIPALEAKRNVIVVYENEKKDYRYDYTLRVLRLSGISHFETIEVSSILEYPLKEDEIIVAVLADSFLSGLINKFGEKNVYKYWVLLGNIGVQYLDVFSPVDEEIVLEIGACNGKTALDFLKWGGDSIKKIYSFESDPVNCENCEKLFREIGDERLELVKKGCWNYTGELTINSGIGTNGSSVGKGGDEIIKVTAIDDIINDEKVTFIKMDIEGAELKALIGAKKCIAREHPRLAICVYHKDDDLVKIPKFLLSIVPEYRFYLRHYTTWDYETFLYAFCPE